MRWYWWMVIAVVVVVGASFVPAISTPISKHIQKVWGPR